MASAAVGCGSSDPPAASTGSNSGTTSEPPVAACTPGEMTRPDGTCQAAGVPADACGDGFAPDADGCAPILPAEPCPPGLMALPGETTCSPVAPCGSGTWGDIPVDATTVYVDGSFSGVGTGSADAPFTTIGEALAAAVGGATIAIAAGSYTEDLKLPKPVVLWGVCPELVEIVGSSAAIAAIDIRTAGTGSEIRSLSITGDAAGVGASGPDALLVDSVWIHDLPRSALLAETALGSTAITVHRLLAEAVAREGILVEGADASMTDVIVRDVFPSAAGAGRGLEVRIDIDNDTPAHVTIDRFIVERAREVGVFASGGELTVARGVVRDIAANASGIAGYGFEIEGYAPMQATTTVHIDTTLVERSTNVAIGIAGADAVIEHTTVRDTAPAEDGTMGRGVSAQDYELPASLAIRWSLVERSYDLGIAVLGLPATLEGVRVRGTRAELSDSTGGRALNVQQGVDLTRRASVDVRWSIFEQSFDIGVVVVGSDATFESVRVGATSPRPSDGAYGDGIAAVAEDDAANVTLTDVWIEGSARAGLACFGCSANLTNSAFECNAIALDGEPYFDRAPSFQDAGDNICGCSGATEACKVLTSQLDPPAPAN